MTPPAQQTRSLADFMPIVSARMAGGAPGAPVHVPSTNGWQRPAAAAGTPARATAGQHRGPRHPDRPRQLEFPANRAPRPLSPGDLS